MTGRRQLRLEPSSGGLATGSGLLDGEILGTAVGPDAADGFVVGPAVALTLATGAALLVQATSIITASTMHAFMES